MAVAIESARPGLGTGIYTCTEAARLLKERAINIRRWAEGYVFKRRGQERKSGPVLDRTEAELGLLTFYDLIEMAFVVKFRHAGVPLQTVRKAADILRDEWATPYPFAQKRLVVDGRALLEKAKFHNVVDKQQVFEFAAEFFKNIDIDENGLAAAWYPLGREKLIVVDPHRSFGAPIEIRSGIRTEILFRQYVAEDRNSDAVADWYDLPQEAVKQAVEFEEEWQEAA